MQRFASVCDLELETLETAAERLAAPPKRGVPRRHLQRMALLVAFSLACVLSWLAVAVSGGERVRASLQGVAQQSTDLPETAPPALLETETEDVQVQVETVTEDVQVETATEDDQAATLQREFALSLSRTAQQTTGPQRGVVMPLFDDIAALGLSNILALRARSVDLPLEVPHCGDLRPEFRQLLARYEPHARVYDVCVAALGAVNVFGANEPLFCASLAECHDRFRGFSIKVLAVLFSHFAEVMLVDADTLFFESPASLWRLERYERTGTLFFPDRISTPDQFLALHVANTTDGQPVSHLQWFLSAFDVSPFETLATIPRARATTRNRMPVTPLVPPSDFLLASHAWNLRAGHAMDSSLVLWSKAKQPRATALLASFLSLNGAHPPPSYGDKELFFVACELAETEYAFADYGVGALGTDLRVHDGKPDSVLCGGGLHYFPDSDSDSNSRSRAGRPLYVNSDDLLTLNVTGDDEIYRSVARPAAFYAGSFDAHGLPQECPFDITVLPLTAEEKAAIAQRQTLHATVRRWEEEEDEEEDEVSDSKRARSRASE